MYIAIEHFVNMALNKCCILLLLLLLMCVSWSSSVSSIFTVSNWVKQGGIMSLFLFNVYIDDLSVNLKEYPTGCIAGGTMVNRLMYADDIVLLSPSATSFSLLFNVCGKYGLEHDIGFNSKKSAVLIFRNSFLKRIITFTPLR